MTLRTLRDVLVQSSDCATKHVVLVDFGNYSCSARNLLQREVETGTDSTRRAFNPPTGRAWADDANCLFSPARHWN